MMTPIPPVGDATPFPPSAPDTPPRILIVDDEELLRMTVADFLEDSGYDPVQAENGRVGVDIWRENRPDCIILDLTMPEMDGFAVLEHIRAEDKDTPVVVVSGVGVVDEALRAIRLGATDFLTKPLHNMSVLQHTMEKAMERTRLIRENRRYQHHLEAEVERQTQAVIALNQEILDTQKEIILTLGEVVETRSQETAYHVRRVAEFTYLLAKGIGLPEDEARTLRIVSPMHDVGKIGIAEAVLQKPGRLTPKEFEIMKTHTTIGHAILAHSDRRIMKTAATVALQHHESWDGTGYPNNLAGEDIHIHGRIVGVADVFDALGQKRVYKDAWPLERILDFMRKQSGRKFDPGVLEVLFDNIDDFVRVREMYPDA